MNTGHTKLRIALMASVSAAALFAANAANAQTPTEPTLQTLTGPFNPGVFVAGAPYVVGGSDNPTGSAGLVGATQVLENLNGTLATTSQFSNNGTPVTTTYQSDSNYGTRYTNAAIPTGSVLIFNAGQGLVQAAPAVTPVFSGPGTNVGAGLLYNVAPAGQNDPNNTYQWVQATYAQSVAAQATPGTGAAAFRTSDGKYLLTSNGTPLTNTQALADGFTNATFTTSVTSAAALAATGVPTSVSSSVSPNAPIPGGVVPSGLLPTNTQWYNGVTGFALTNGTTSTTISTTGISTTGSLSAATLTTTGNATVGGTLTVTGATTTNGITNNGLITTNSLRVNGQTTVHDFTVTGPSNGGAASNVSLGGNVVHDVAAPVVGTDAANKAYVDKGDKKAYEGTAIALAISQPVFLPGQNFAFRVGYGGYESQNAVGFSAAGVIARDLFGYGSTVSLDGGVGFGTENSGVAGKAGVTIGFGGGFAPLK